jgi:hypothetical protein
LKRKIDSSQIKVCILKNEIDRLKEFFTSYQYIILYNNLKINFRDEFENSNKLKIEELFNYLYKIITYNYNTAMHILNQCQAEQKIQIDQRLVKL